MELNSQWFTLPSWNALWLRSSLVFVRQRGGLWVWQSLTVVCLLCLVMAGFSSPFWFHSCAITIQMWSYFHLFSWRLAGLSSLKIRILISGNVLVITTALHPLFIRLEISGNCFWTSVQPSFIQSISLWHSVLSFAFYNISSTYLKIHFFFPGPLNIADKC